MTIKNILFLTAFTLCANQSFGKGNDTITKNIIEPIHPKTTHEVGVNLAPLIFSGWGGNNAIYYYKMHLPSGKLSLRANFLGDNTMQKRDMNPNNPYMNQIPDQYRYSNDNYYTLTLQLGVQHRLKHFEGTHTLDVFCFEGFIIGKNKNQYQSLYAMDMHQISGEPKYHLDRFQIATYSTSGSTYGAFAGIGATFTIIPHVKLTLESTISGQVDKNNTDDSKNYYIDGLNGFEKDGNTETVRTTSNTITTFQLRPTTILYLAYSF